MQSELPSVIFVLLALTNDRIFSIAYGKMKLHKFCNFKFYYDRKIHFSVCVQLHNAIKRWDAGVIFYSDVRYERHFLIGFFAISGNIKLYLYPFFILVEEG